MRNGTHTVPVSELGGAPESLKDQADDLHEEARMILPGLQASCGFQLIAVFNQRFSDLTYAAQIAHVAALLLTIVAMGLLVTPAAVHRLSEPAVVSHRFVTLSSRLIAAALLPLALGIAIDAWVVTSLVFEPPLEWMPWAIGVAVFAALITLWLVFPYARGRRSRG